MKNTAIKLISIALVGMLASCASRPNVATLPSPVAIPLPKQQKVADTSNTDKKITEVKEAIARVDKSSNDLSDKLDDIVTKNTEVKEKVGKAYSEGLVAGSVEAKSLKDSVELVELKLEESVVIRDELKLQLNESNKVIQEAKKEVSNLRVSIAKMYVEVEELRRVAKETNKRITLSSKQVESLKVEVITKQANIDNLKKWRLWLGVALGILLPLNIVYVVARLKGFGWVR